MSLQTKTKEISSVEKQVFIEFPKSYFDNDFEAKVKDYSKKIELKGYRKGKVPKKVILERFSSSIKGEILEKVVQENIDKACKQEKLTPIAIKEVKDLKFENVDPISFNVFIEIDQDVEIRNYKNLGIKSEIPTPISEDDVDKEIINYAKSLAEEQEVTVKAKKGHVVVGVYTQILLNGESQEISQPQFRIELGMQKIAAFDDTLLGIKKGKEVKVKFKYDKNYEIESLRCKKAMYTLKVESIKELILPEINDEMAKKAGVESLNKLKESIKHHLKQKQNDKTLNKSQDEIIRKIIDQNPFDLPNVRINHYMKMQMQSNQKEEISDEDLSKLPKIQKEALELEAIFALKRHKILQNILQQENLKVNQAQVDEHIKQMSQQWNMSFDDLKTSLRKSGRINEIREELKMKNTLDFLLESNKEEK